MCMAAILNSISDRSCVCVCVLTASRRQLHSAIKTLDEWKSISDAAGWVSRTCHFFQCGIDDAIMTSGIINISGCAIVWFIGKADGTASRSVQCSSRMRMRAVACCGLGALGPQCASIRRSVRPLRALTRRNSNLGWMQVGSKCILMRLCRKESIRF